MFWFIFILLLFVLYKQPTYTGNILIQGEGSPLWTTRDVSEICICSYKQEAKRENRPRNYLLFDLLTRVTPRVMLPILFTANYWQHKLENAHANAFQSPPIPREVLRFHLREHRHCFKTVSKTASLQVKEYH